MLKDKNKKKASARQRRHWSIRKRVIGTKERPRLVVFRSLSHIYAQLIDDTEHRTILASSTRAKDLKLEAGKKKAEQSFQVGMHLGKLALENGITKICFDRSGYKYHGRVKALADGARKAGLAF
jgi:large subunit ribosomal protein L18